LAAAKTKAEVIGESAIRSGVPATEPVAIVAAAKAEAGMGERIESEMLKGVFPTPYQPVTVTTALIKSLPTGVFPIIVVTVIVFPIIAVMVIVFPVIAVTVIVFPVIAISAIVLPIIAVSVAPSSVLSKGVNTAGGDQERCDQSD